MCAVWVRSTQTEAHKKKLNLDGKSIPIMLKIALLKFIRKYKWGARVAALILTLVLIRASYYFDKKRLSIWSALSTFAAGATTILAVKAEEFY